MFLSAEIAAKIAKEEGLTISDAVALRALADDENEARTIARKFANKDSDAEMQSIAKGVFDNAKRTASKRWSGNIKDPQPPAA